MPYNLITRKMITYGNRLIFMRIPMKYLIKVPSKRTNYYNNNQKHIQSLKWMEKEMENIVISNTERLYVYGDPKKIFCDHDQSYYYK